MNKSLSKLHIIKFIPYPSIHPLEISTELSTHNTFKHNEENMDLNIYFSQQPSVTLTLAIVKA